MALVSNEPPAEVQEVIEAALQQFREVPADRQHATRGLDISSLHATAPLEMFNVGLSDLKAGSLRKVQKTGWRYLLRENDDVVASAEAVTDARGGSPRFSQFNRGPFVASTAAAVEGARELVDEKEDYEPSILNIPALYVVIMWFRHPAGKDVYVPLAPAPAGLEAGRSYSAGEILPLLQEKARAIPELGPDDTRGG